MNTYVTNATLEDLSIIYRLFEEAILFQKTNNYIGWKDFDKAYLKNDIQTGLLFKIVKDNNIVCIFSVCYDDALIWRERETGDAIYLHRIVLNRAFKGEKAFKNVLDWAACHAISRGSRFIRMDTWAENEKIIEYYKSYGFNFIENYTTSETQDLPVQHRDLKVALLELDIRKVIAQRYKMSVP